MFASSSSRPMLTPPSSTSCAEESARFYAAEVLHALEYLHEKGFIYRDLKPENILVHQSGHCRLIDFDLSKQSKVAKREVKVGHSKRLVAVPDIVTHSFVGTEEYIAPEIIKGPHNASVDWWTLGILLYEMVFGRTPFRGTSQEKTFSKIQAGKISFPETPKVSKHCKDIIKKLLATDPRKRLGCKGGAQEIKSHSFFKVRHLT